MRRITEPFDAEDVLQMPVGYSGTTFDSVITVDYGAAIYPANQYRGFVISPALGVSWHGFYLYIYNNVADNSQPFFALIASSGAVQIHMTRDPTTALLNIWKGGTLSGDNISLGGRTLIGTSIHALAQGSRYHVQIGFDAAGQTVGLKIDGVDSIAATGVTGLSAYYSTMIRQVTASGQPNFGFDSFYINDDDNSDGYNENTWGGIIKMISAVPPADGFYTAWSKSTGVQGFELVNETPYNGDTDYVYSQTTAQRISFTVAPHGLTSPSEIHAVSARHVVRKISGGQVIPFFRIGGSNYFLGGGAGTPQDVGVDYMVVMDRRRKNPATTNDWLLGDTIESVGLESVL